MKASPATTTEPSTHLNAGIVSPRESGSNSRESLICAGISCRTARERSLDAVAVAGDEHRAVLRQLRLRFGNGVVLSTCNRTELYVITPEVDSAISALRDFLGALGRREREDPVPELDQQIYVHVGVDAVRHLFSVASGLDSVILGEVQVASQVARSIQMSIANDTACPAAIEVFNRAIRTTRKVKLETGLNRGRVTTASIAVGLVTQRRGGIDNARVLVVGAGEMARSVIHRLRRSGVSDLKVVSRTFSRAAELATETRAVALPFDQLAVGLNTSDVWVTCTSSSETLIGSAEVRQAATRMKNRRIIVVDLALPPDLEPEAAREGVIDYIDLRDIGRVGAARRHDLLAEASKAREIIDSEALKAVMAAETRCSTPTVKALGEKAEAIRRVEVQKAIRILGQNRPSGIESVIEAMSQSIVKKLMAHPISFARNNADNAPVVSSVFGVAAD